MHEQAGDSQYRYLAREAGAVILQFDTVKLLADIEAGDQGACIAAFPHEWHACVKACKMIMDQTVNIQCDLHRAVPRIDIEHASILVKHAIGDLHGVTEILRVATKAKLEKFFAGNFLSLTDSRIIILDGRVDVLLMCKEHSDKNDVFNGAGTTQQCIGQLSRGDSFGLIRFDSTKEVDILGCTLRCRRDVVVLRVERSDIMAIRADLQRGELQSAAVAAFLHARTLDAQKDSPLPEPNSDQNFFLTSIESAPKTAHVQATRGNTSQKQFTVAAPLQHPLSSPRTKAQTKAAEKSSTAAIQPIKLLFKRVLNGCGNFNHKERRACDKKDPQASRAMELGLNATSGSSIYKSHSRSSMGSRHLRSTNSLFRPAKSAVDVSKLKKVTKCSSHLRPSIPTGARRMRFQQQWRKTVLA